MLRHDLTELQVTDDFVVGYLRDGSHVRVPRGKVDSVFASRQWNRLLLLLGGFLVLTCLGLLGLIIGSVLGPVWLVLVVGLLGVGLLCLYWAPQSFLMVASSSTLMRLSLRGLDQQRVLLQIEQSIFDLGVLPDLVEVRPRRRHLLPDLVEVDVGSVEVPDLPLADNGVEVRLSLDDFIMFGAWLLATCCLLVSLFYGWVRLVVSGFPGRSGYVVRINGLASWRDNSVTFHWDSFLTVFTSQSSLAWSNFLLGLGACFIACTVFLQVFTLPVLLRQSWRLNLGVLGLFSFICGSVLFSGGLWLLTNQDMSRLHSLTITPLVILPLCFLVFHIISLVMQPSD